VVSSPKSKGKVSKNNLRGVGALELITYHDAYVDITLPYKEDGNRQWIGRVCGECSCGYVCHVREFGGCMQSV